MKESDRERRFKGSIQMGKQNKKLMSKVSGWCKNLNTELTSYGILAETTGLPIGSIRVKCQYADGGFEGMDLEWILKDFLSTYCDGCSDHKPGKSTKWAEEIIEKSRKQAKKEREEEKHREEFIKEWRKENKEELQRKKKSENVSEASILKLLENLLDDQQRDKTSKKLKEAIGIAPKYFGDSAIDFLLNTARGGPLSSISTQLLIKLLNSDRTDFINRAVDIALKKINEAENVELSAKILVRGKDLGLDIDISTDQYETLLLSQNYNYLLSDPEDINYEASNKLLMEWYQREPEKCKNIYIERLTSKEKAIRFNTVKALQNTFPVGIELTKGLFDVLVKSWKLPDSREGIGSAEKQVGNLIAKLLLNDPDFVISNLEDFFWRSNEEFQEIALNVFDSVFRNELAQKDAESIEDSEKRESAKEALDWLVQRLWDNKASTGAKYKTTRILKLVSKRFPDFLVKYLDKLTGKLIMISNQEEPADFNSSKIIKPGDQESRFHDRLKNIGKHQEFRNYRGSLKEVLKNLGQTKPSATFETTENCFRNLKSRDHPEAKGYLIEVLGEIASFNAEMKSKCLPNLLEGLQDFDSPLVRGKAIGAFQKGFNNFSSIPENVQYLLLLYIIDPNYFVHKKAVNLFRAIRINDESLKEKLILQLLKLLGHYKTEQGEEHFIEKICNVIYYTSLGNDRFENVYLNIMLDLIPTGDDTVDWKLLEKIWDLAEPGKACTGELVNKSCAFLEKYPRGPYGGTAREPPWEFLRFLYSLGRENFQNSEEDILDLALSQNETYPFLSLVLANLFGLNGNFDAMVSIHKGIFESMKAGRKKSKNGLEIKRHLKLSKANQHLFNKEMDDAINIFEELSELTDEIQALSNNTSAKETTRSKGITSKSLDIISESKSTLFDHSEDQNQLPESLSNICSKSKDINWQNINERQEMNWGLFFRVSKFAKTLLEYEDAVEKGQGKETLEKESLLDGTKILLKNKLKNNSFPVLNNGICSQLFSLLDQGLPPVEEILTILKEYRLNPLYEIEEGSSKSKSKNIQKDDSPKIVKLEAYLDGHLWESTKILKPDKQFDLTLKGKVKKWPQNVEFLKFNMLTTCLSEDFSISNFKIPIDPSQKEFEMEGHFTFKVSKGFLQDPITISVEAELLDSEENERTLDVVGNYQLKAIPSEKVGREVAQVNKTLFEKCEKASRGLPDLKDEIDNNFPVFQSLAEYTVKCNKRADFKDVTERDESILQENLRTWLDSKFLGEVTEHPKEGGGESDLVCKGVRIELKVEEEVSDRDKIAEKYAEQAVQYGSSALEQMAVMVVLDITPKNKPPSDIRNEILIKDVPTHGVDPCGTYPSKALMFVVNGNTENPSSYS